MLYMGFAVVGMIAGILSGLFGIGGGVLIVPALVYGFGFSQKMATGTSLAILLPPVGIAAVWEYYRAGDVNWKAALIIAAMVLVGSWLGARGAGQINPQLLKTLFGVFLMLVGAYIIFEAIRS